MNETRNHRASHTDLQVDGIVTARDRNAPSLHFACVHGDEEYLKRRPNCAVQPVR
jgi:hypothetical protein